MKARAGAATRIPGRNRRFSRRKTDQRPLYFLLQTEPKKEPHYIIFLPDYSYKDEDLTQFLHYDRYKIVRYSQLASFFESQNCNLPYYDDFKKALRKHATEYKKDLYEIMKDRFTAEIRSHKQLKKRVEDYGNTVAD